MKLYSLYDRIAEEFSPPWVAQTDGVAIRQTIKIMQETPHADDYILYNLGTWSASTGMVDPLEKPKSVPFNASANIEAS